ncbi:hypothetical protein PPYR_01180 [Photinus pyralis]|uniref:Retrotransposon gag domain-containing protein n=1 Tax=Photinus pyralis TaxID=7054 RepID=A0A5N4ATA3_PHOPY|nr:hypothetical protein PPYR_06200 [Photinus pyralis]KAB0804210.1 hypothetical protein PPYR_01180 [Photinus pyralis]
MALIGSIEHFKGNAEEFEMYIERVEHLFLVNCVEEKMKVSLFITLAGPVVYSTLKNLVAPQNPAEKSYEQVITVLRGHYVPEKSEISERFRFNKCNQKPDQSVAEYIVELKQLSNTCKFGAFLEEALRDRLVCGLYSEALQKKLLAERELTFAKACTMAQAHEMAASQVKLLSAGEVHSMKKTESSRVSYNTKGSNNRQSSSKQSSSKPSTNQQSEQSKQNKDHVIGVAGATTQICVRQPSGNVSSAEREDTLPKFVGVRGR